MKGDPPARNVVIVGLLRSNDDILLVRTRRHPRHWQPIGGGVGAKDETPLTALVRELQEETGVNLPQEAFQFELSLPYDFGDGQVQFYTARLTDNAKLDFAVDEIIECRWTSLEEAARLPMYSASRHFIAHLRARCRVDSSVAPDPLCTALTLPCGAQLTNRVAKAALSETLATPTGEPTTALLTLYRRWSGCGAGLLMTGNAMVDANAIYERGNVILDGQDGQSLRDWAATATRYGAQAWVQLNHPGRRARLTPTRSLVGPSPVPIMTFPYLKVRPRELSEEDILAMIDRFARAAALVKSAGFSGVQLHAAHDFLCSQFLSPRLNTRTDHWGGTIEGRSRFVVSLIRAMRLSVGDRYPVGIKLSSADFLRADAAPREIQYLIRALDEEGVDLIEIAGGCHRMSDAGERPPDPVTVCRDRYFNYFAELVRSDLHRCPLMITGGFESLATIRRALAAGVTDIVGLGRPFAVDPELLQRGVQDESASLVLARPARTGIAKLDYFIDLYWHVAQIHRIGSGLEPDVNLGPWRTMAMFGSSIVRQFVR